MSERRSRKGQKAIPEEAVPADAVVSEVHDVPETPVEAPTEVETVEIEAEETEIEAETVEIKAEKAGKTIPEPDRSEEMPEKAYSPGNPSLREEMKAILNVKKGKRAVPTRVTYYSQYSRSKRWVIIDVNNYLLSEAWKVYKEKSEDKDPDVFMATVYDLLQVEIPRMYVAVAEIELV